MLAASATVSHLWRRVGGERGREAIVDDTTNLDLALTIGTPRDATTAAAMVLSEAADRLIVECRGIAGRLTNAERADLAIAREAVREAQIGFERALRQ